MSLLFFPLSPLTPGPTDKELGHDRRWGLRQCDVVQINSTVCLEADGPGLAQFITCKVLGQVSQFFWSCDFTANVL